MNINLLTYMADYEIPNSNYTFLAEPLGSSAFLPAFDRVRYIFWKYCYQCIKRSRQNAFPGELGRSYPG